MKLISPQALVICGIAFLASLCIMVIVDYLLGSEAEHLNSWAIITRLVGYDAGIPDSLAIRKLGLGGATFLMIVVNFVLGLGVIQGLKFIIHLLCN